MRTTLGVLAVLFLSSTAWGNLLVNGSFETPEVLPGSFSTFNVGDSSTGWTVTGLSGNIAFLNTTFSCCGGITYTAAQGAQSADLTGTSDDNVFRGVRQLVTPPSPGLYTLTFEIGNYSDPNGSGSPGATVIDLYFDAQQQDEFTNSSNTTGLVNWQPFTFTFFSNGDPFNIEFRNNGTAFDNYAGLDNVSLDATAAVPEPGTVATLLGGVFLLGGLRLRTRRRA